MSIKYLESAKTVFWDFDGVIKDSVEIKSIAFGQLFIEFGGDVYNPCPKSTCNCGIYFLPNFG